MPASKRSEERKQFTEPSNVSLHADGLGTSLQYSKHACAHMPLL